MKKTPKSSPVRGSRVAEMRAEYDFSGGERGKIDLTQPRPLTRP